jgi:hypothetical protein
VSFENEIASILSEKSAFLEESIFYPEMGFEYWHSTVVSKDGRPISGGFSTERMQARKIAIAEFLERHEVESLSKAGELVREEWGLNKIPTACGFAAGFDEKNTIQRSLNEAIERWVASNWIDGRKYIEEIPFEAVQPGLNPACLFFISKFVQVRFFKKEVLVWLDEKPVQISVVMTLGLTDRGIFPGHSTQNTNGSIWSHALLESFRHLIGIKNNPDPVDIFPVNKVRFFAENKQIALDQVSNACDSKWPVPQIELQRVKSFGSGNFFLARTIISGWSSWHSGPITRFLY